ncbi:acyl-CoA-binding domain-containing protein 1-like protein [Tanacetum coccineum]
MGPVFSSFIHEEESDELKLDAIHAFAREGDTENLIKCVEGGIAVDMKDSEGRTPLHWAVDRGHIEATELLLSRNADVNLKDYEGQTPLHYAAVCDRESIAELLVKKNAATNIKDDDGSFELAITTSWFLVGEGMSVLEVDEVMRGPSIHRDWSRGTKVFYGGSIGLKGGIEVVEVRLLSGERDHGVNQVLARLDPDS